MVNMTAAWNRFWFTGYSAESLGLVRFCFGLGLFFFNLTQFWTLILIDPTGGSFFYIRPVWYFEPFGLVQNYPLFDLFALGALQLATLSMAFGHRTRLSTILVIVLVCYLRGVRDSILGEGHHRYHVPVNLLLILAVSKCGGAHSLDARRRASGSGPPAVAEWEASWPLMAMQLYTASFYFWSFIAKVRTTGWNWFFDPRRIQDLLLERSLTWGVTADGEPVFNALPYWLSQQEELCRMLGVGTLILEAGFPLILLVKRPLARLLFLAGVAFFHLANLVLAYVSFALLPICFFVFFDLEDARVRLARWWEARGSARVAQRRPG